MMCMKRAFFVVFLLIAQASHACQTALILSMDVSNSVDVGEYRIQVDGLAAALQDREIAEILVQDQVSLSVIQWSGVDRQVVSIDWQQMRSAADVRAFAAQTRALPRAFVLSDTAPAEAMMFAINHFPNAPKCARWVVDMSGDGTANSGGSVSATRRLAERRGITFNALAIESMGQAITNYYRKNVLTQDGFVMTAAGFQDYPPMIREKLLRELRQLIGEGPDQNGTYRLAQNRANRLMSQE